MKFTWLEKLAESGYIRPEALERIYENCSAALEEHEKFAEIPEGIQMLLQALAGGAVLGAAGTAVGAGYSALSNRIQDAKMLAQTDMVRKRVINSGRFLEKKDKEKAEARFNEILKFAPSLGANEAVMAKMVADKLNTGLTNQDVQNLISIQVKMTPDPLQYSAMSSAVKTAEAVVGEKLADAYIELEKRASVGTQVAGGFPAVAKHVLSTLGLSAGIAGIMGGAKFINDKIDEHKLKNQLEESFLTALKNNPELRENTQQAKMHFNTLAHFAPHIANEPLAAASFMLKIKNYGGAANAADIKDITEVERNMRGTGTGVLDTLDKGLNTAGFGRLLGNTVYDLTGPRRMRMDVYPN